MTATTDFMCPTCGNHRDVCAEQGICSPDPLADMRNGVWLDQQVFPPIEWAVPGVIPEGMSLIVGPPKAGKSWLVCALAVAMSSGGRALGRIPVDGRPTLYLALEDGDRRLQDRFRKVAEHDPLPADLYRLTRLAGTIDATVRAFFEMHPRGVVFLDTLGRVMSPARPGETTYERDYRIGASLKRLSDEYPGSSLVVVHHDRKAKSADFIEAVSGTNGLAGSADTIIVLSRERQSKDGLLKVTGRDVDEHEYAVVMEDGCIWRLDGNTLTDAASAAATRHATEGLADRSAAILSYAAARYPESVTPAEIADRCDLSSDDAGRYLRRLAESGRLVRTGRGVYRAYVSEPSEVSEVDETDTQDTSDTLWIGDDE